MVFNILQIILAVLLMVAVLLQAKGTGLGAGFGGDGGNLYHTRRGVEKNLHTTTIVITILFFGVALANVLFG